MCPSFPFGIEGVMWDVIVLIPDHCLSIYFLYTLLLLGENGTSKETGSQDVDKYRR